MVFQIGFFTQQSSEKSLAKAATAQVAVAAPKKSLVQIAFPGRGMNLTYFNEQFDLHKGDLVYVDGKLEGITGRVVDVHYNFKIKVSDYQKVIAVVDRSFNGELLIGGSHFMTFDRDILPVSKISRWFLPPAKEGEYVIGTDGESFYLDDLSTIKISSQIAQRGYDYYCENRVAYLCVDGETGYAVVTGTKNYEVEFTYRDGEISALTCTCPCGYNCKHEFAVVLQLRETLGLARKHYSAQFDGSYFAAISKDALFTYAVGAMTTGKVSFSDTGMAAYSVDPIEPGEDDWDDEWDEDDEDD